MGGGVQSRARERKRNPPMEKKWSLERETQERLERDLAKIKEIMCIVECSFLIFRMS